MFQHSGDGFDGVDSLEYRESGFQTNQNYFVDNDEGGKTQIVDYQNDPNSISGASDKHDLFEFSDASFVNPDDQVYPFEYQLDGFILMDGTDIYTLEVRDPQGYGDIYDNNTQLTYFVDDLGGNRVQVTDVSGNEYSIDHVYWYASRKEDLFYYDDMMLLLLLTLMTRSSHLNSRTHHLEVLMM